MKRKSITPKKRIEIFNSQSGKCWECPEPLIQGQWQVDHRQALIHGGNDAEDNLRGICLSCHKKKTKRDVSANAKVKRLQGLGKLKPKRKWPKRTFLTKGVWRSK